jgi:hypothetical protein
MASPYGASRSNAFDTPHAAGIHWTSDQPDSHAPAGFEPAIAAKERPQTHVLDRAATGTDQSNICVA